MTNQSFSHRGRETPAFRFLRCENCREVASALAVVEGDHFCLLTKPQGSYLSEGDTIRPGRIVKVPSGPPCLGKNWDITGTGNTFFPSQQMITFPNSRPCLEKDRVVICLKGIRFDRVALCRVLSKFQAAPLAWA